MARRRTLQASTSLALVALSPVVVFHWHIGPVVAVLTPEHGIHSGDALGVAALAAGLLLWPRSAAGPRGVGPATSAIPVGPSGIPTTGT